MTPIHSSYYHWVSIAFLSLCLPCWAKVTFDNTLGQRVTPDTLSGDFKIPAERGETHGANLFHSFSAFNIQTGESATFTGPPAIDNVISRVTGGSQSFIDGPLRSEIESANLWFINPAGVLFGQHAKLDVQGSFHVSTADYLKLGEGGRFDATNPESSLLTTAPPEAFGFLGNKQPAGIRFEDSNLTLDNKTFSVIGGDIAITGKSFLGVTHSSQVKQKQALSSPRVTVVDRLLEAAFCAVA